MLGWDGKVDQNLHPESVIDMLGRGRKGVHPAIGSIRQLTADEVKNVERKKGEPIKRYRDSHHRMARLFASGLRVNEVAELTGYSIARVSVFHSTPSFQELISEKRKVEDQVSRDSIQAYNEMILANGLKAERKLADKLDDDDDSEEMSVRELISISRDAADRVGLSKRTVQANVNLDFASLLDRAIARTQATLPRSGDLKLITATDEIASQAQVPDRGASSTIELQPQAGYPITHLQPKAGYSSPVVRLKRRI